MTPLKLHAEPLQNNWLDDYGHLNEAYYLVPFSNTTWRVQEHFGLGVEYFKQTGCALYTVETHLRYLREVRAPAQLEIETLILGCDEKRIHLAHMMLAADTLRATGEFMMLHYNTREQRTAPLPPAVYDGLQAACLDEKPEWVGRRLSLAKR